jgi:hypothetical protein
VTNLAIFAAFAGMAASLLRNLRLALFILVVSVALLETTHNYNPFHAYPLWFGLGLGFVFLSIWLYNEALERRSAALESGAAVAYLMAMLTYEVFLGYGVVLAAVAYRNCRSLDGFRARVAYLARRSRQWGAAALAYGAAYLWFSHAHPSQYPGAAPGSLRPLTVAKTVFAFSITGLNLSGLKGSQWRLDIGAAIGAGVVTMLGFYGFRHFAGRFSFRSLLRIACWALAGMVVPNVLYGFAARYQRWAETDVAFYIGSFSGALPFGTLLVAVCLIVCRMGSRRVWRCVIAAVCALLAGVGAYANACRREEYFAQARENRMLWSLVEASLTGPSREMYTSAKTLIAPSILRMPGLSPGIYDYWTYYFSDKLGRPFHVVGNRTEYAALAPEFKAPRALALAVKWNPSAKAGVFGLGNVDVAEWEAVPDRLHADRACLGVVGDGSDVSIMSGPGGKGSSEIHAHTPSALSDVRDLDLNALTLRRY